MNITYIQSFALALSAIAYGSYCVQNYAFYFIYANKFSLFFIFFSLFF